MFRELWPSWNQVHTEGHQYNLLLFPKWPKHPEKKPVNVHLIYLQLGGNCVMKVCESEMPHGWVKPGPLQVSTQGIICNLKAFSALNVNSSFLSNNNCCDLHLSVTHSKALCIGRWVNHSHLPAGKSGCRGDRTPHRTGNKCLLSCGFPVFCCSCWLKAGCLSSSYSALSYCPFGSSSMDRDDVVGSQYASVLRACQ